jgi:hypothetical protein
LAVLFASPVPAYSIPSGPNAMRPPLWMPAAGMPWRMTWGAPPSWKRTMRLSAAVV